eukprot:TRINITY_DN12033_c0_g1_i2.p1 TRINITY_DN12033_c0_g1~~TRINITY_DN12033_c0_g1_i2.p1  ORF type:complete len:1040 (-),score=170.87 TRINITY_DN12033_c0_g1_i2:163-3246(-)
MAPNLFIAIVLPLAALSGSYAEEGFKCADCEREIDHHVMLLQTSSRMQPAEMQATKAIAAGDSSASSSPTSTGIGMPVALVLGSCLLLVVLRKIAASVDECAPIVAEFVGTFALVFTVGCCVITGSSAWNATAIGCVLMVMVYATGPISGGHLNPAVSLSLALTGKFEWAKLPAYVAAQIIAGLAAGSCFCALFEPKTANVAPSEGFSWLHAGTVEMIYTFMLCFVVSNCAGSKRNNEQADGNQFFGLAIGFVIIAGGYAAGGVSGAAFNPAVALGLDFTSRDVHWGLFWALFEILGASLAAAAYRVVRPEDYSDGDLTQYEPSLPVKLLSEFLGAFMLVLTVGLNVVTGSSQTAWSAAAALMCMIYSLGDVSGAHFNPAVTVAVHARGNCSTQQLISYIPVQLLAGVAAGALHSVFHSVGPEKNNAHSLQPGNKHTMPHAVIAEFVYTCVLCYVVLACATISKPASQLTKQNYYFGLAIASCVTAGGFAIGGVSGGELNPAVSTGIAVASSMYTPKGATMIGSNGVNLLLLGVWEIAGGLLASLIFRVTHAQEFGQATPPGMVQKCACEFLGVFVLVFTVVCQSLSGAAFGATSIACSLMVMIYATGPISGGHLNPAVSFALALSEKMKWSEVPVYWITQLMAGILAGFMACSLFTDTVDVAPKDTYSGWHAYLAETLYTFMLCFVVLNAAGSKRNNSPTDGNNFFALAIGFVIIAGGNAVGGVSGAAFNPAVALGLDFSSHEKGVGNGFLWALFELVGAAIAAAIYRNVRPEDYGNQTDFDTYKPAWHTKLVSEFLGVFFLVLTVGLNLCNGSAVTAWSAAAALMCMIYSLGDVSGAHFNPAVTLACMASGRDLINTFDGLAYMVVQVLAGVIAGCLYSVFHRSSLKETSPITLTPGDGFSIYQAGMAEFAATALLAYIVLSCATVAHAGSQKTKNSFYFALCIGSCVTVGGFAVGAASGGELNPAVAAGIATASSVFQPGGQSAPMANFVTLGLYELAGGLLGAVAFQATHAKQYVDVCAGSAL